LISSETAHFVGGLVDYWKATSCQKLSIVSFGILAPKILIRLLRSHHGEERVHFKLRVGSCVRNVKRVLTITESLGHEALLSGSRSLFLREILRKSAPAIEDPEMLVYSAVEVPAIDVGQLVYFCASVFWRASVRGWSVFGEIFEPIDLGDKYQEELRRYLPGEGTFPDIATVSIFVSQLNKPLLIPSSWQVLRCTPRSESLRSPWSHSSIRMSFTR